LWVIDDRIPKNHLLRRINAFMTEALAFVHEQLDPYYSEIGRPSVDPELMIRMLILGYCYGLRSERKLTQEVELHLAYRRFCRLDLNDKVPHHSTFSENWLHRFRESDVSPPIRAARTILRLWRGAMLDARDSLHQFAVGAKVTQGDRVGGG
jgi:transposase